jgi:hypothetical protein
MKMFKTIIITIALGVAVASCDLTEEPTFLSEESAYSSLTNAKATLDGTYASFAAYGYFGYDFIYSSFGASGFFVSGKGNSNTHPDNANLCSLDPLNASPATENPWKDIYKSIERANGIINNMEVYENPETNTQQSWNNVIGHGYFIRAFDYFNLVRLWGEVPLRLEVTTPDNIHIPKSTTDVIYQQILDDIAMAKKLMFPHGREQNGLPAAEAASMLEAKVYMTMATTDDAVPVKDPAVCWQKAYDAAKEVYGKYRLVNDYGSLFEENSSDGTPENIFEIQFNDVVKSNHGKIFTASKAVLSQTWGRLRINGELVDIHYSLYPNDYIRLKQTFKSTWVDIKGKTQKVYPVDDKRKTFAKGFPYVFKHWQKNKMATTAYYMKNFIVYRYADLLLMLAEISNELQNGEEFGYVNEVLARVGLSTDDFVPNADFGADYNGGQEGFRNAIMLEYRTELLGEGHDWFNNRRRGYDYFKHTVIDAHNNWSKFDSKIDVTLKDDPAIVMHFKIPLTEINRNNEIND